MEWYINKKSKIFIAGHLGMVGSSILKCFIDNKYLNLIYKSRNQLDLTNQKDTQDFFEKELPDYVIIAAAKVGGILANKTYVGQFIYENLEIQNNLIHFSYKYGVKKLIFLGSSCIYPRLANQPIKEKYLMKGPLEPTNEFYAIAKIAGIKICEAYFHQYGANFLSIMPTNLYGPNDNFDLETSHVLPALIRKMHNGKIEKKNHVEIWGSGNPLREFLYVTDLAEAVLFVIKNIDAKEIYDLGISQINIGSGNELSIRDLSNLIKKIVNYDGKLVFNTQMPDGMPRKFLDNSIINKKGWYPKISLEEGIHSVYRWYKNNEKKKNPLKIK